MNFNKEACWVVMVIVIAVILNFSTISLAQEIQTDEEENKIFSLVFGRDKKGDKFNVIRSKTWTSKYYKKRNRGLKRLKDYMKKRLNLPENKASLIIDAFFEKNNEQAVISLQSDRAHGYLIERKFSNMELGFFQYFPLFRKEYIGAEDAFIVSRPYYDKTLGIVLLYINWMGGPHFGQSEIVQYQYKDGKLVQVASVVLVVS